LRASSLFDAETAVASDAGFSCVVLSWKLCAQDLAQGLRVIELIRRRTSGMPILLAMTREDRSRVPLAYVECMDEAFTQLPDAELSPHATYSQLVRRNVEKIPVSALPDCIVAVQLVPYPPRAFRS
jgi:arginine/lysine/ornithine decarboxylase